MNAKGWLLLAAGMVMINMNTNAAPKKFTLAPAVAVEAESFTIDNGWKVIQWGHGNYMSDIIGFNHCSGERLLELDAAAAEGMAHKDIRVPVSGDYRLWVRYEYPPFTECRFKVVIEQGGKQVAGMEMGKKESPRLAFNETRFRAQYDPSWGSEGYAEEVLPVKGLRAGAARIVLQGVSQPQIPGVSAKRFIDVIYLSSDVQDAWRTWYRRRDRNYPILDAIRDTVGPRWEIQVKNKSEKPQSYSISWVYNRLPWGMRGAPVKGVPAGTASAWTGLIGQDTAHFSLLVIRGKGAFEVSLRGFGPKKVLYHGTANGMHRVYLPTYPGWGETPITPEQEIDTTLALIKKSPKVGRNPTQPLCYGGWIPVVGKTAYNRKYAELYWAIGMRAVPSTIASMDQAKQALGPLGFKPNRSLAATGYRNPPTVANVARAKKKFSTQLQYLKWYDYGDEILFGEWVTRMLTAKAAAQKGKKKEQILQDLWQAWLKKNRPQHQAKQAWSKPDSSAKAATVNPELFVDSTLFYEDAAIDWVKTRKDAAKAALGKDVLCGANYSCHPFYYPQVAMYVKWFRDGAADYGRHSEYFWQVTQAGPMINGYIAEHFRCGMRNDPQAINRQYTMPHFPGNTVPSFLRTAFTHLAHGAKMLDFFGIGMNECFTENHIDHRAHQMYLAIRDVTHSMGLVEDLLPKSRAVASPVALLVSDSTEIWDTRAVALDRAGHSFFGANFRKTRLSYHQDRVGIWEALTFAGYSPDLLVEEDLNAKVLKGYRVLYLVGDHLPQATVAPLQKWVKAGGILVADAGAGRYDRYMNANPELQKLLGIKSQQVEEKTVFIRPRQELPFLKPLGKIQGKEWTMPVLAVHARVQPVKGVEILATFEDGKPAFMRRSLGKGQVYVTPSLPGLAYLYSGLQPPMVPDRGPNTHTVPIHFDAGAKAMLLAPIRAGKVSGTVEVLHGGLLDARLLDAKTGYILPIANYNRIPMKQTNFDVLQKGATTDVKIAVRVSRPVTRAVSAYLGNLSCQQKDGRVIIHLPKLGYGDIIRLN